MRHKMILGDPVLVHAAPVDEATSRWGVYCIPKLWRRMDGTLVVRLNGAEDTGRLLEAAPNLYFLSEDEGKTWRFVPDGEREFAEDIPFFSSINPLFTRLRNGDTVGFRRLCRPAVTGVSPRKHFPNACGSNAVNVYRWGDIQGRYAGLAFVRCRAGRETAVEITLDCPELEVAANAAYYEDGREIATPVSLWGNDFCSPYPTALTELHDGTFAALFHAQSPLVEDRVCENVYFAVSETGKDWRIRALAADGGRMDTRSGAVADGAEMSLTQTEDGTLLIALRNDCSLGEPHFCDCTLVRSKDNGYSWSEPVSVSDSSVTPHILSFPDNCAVLITGRPGVHCRLSEDGGESFGEPLSVIGDGLAAELAKGKTYLEAKYTATSSYSNTFVERLTPDTCLLVYNDLQYDPGDGLAHKAAFVRTLTVV